MCRSDGGESEQENNKKFLKKTEKNEKFIYIGKMFSRKGNLMAMTRRTGFKLNG